MKQSANACPILSFTLSHFVVAAYSGIRRLAVNANDFSHFARSSFLYFVWFCSIASPILSRFSFFPIWLCRFTITNDYNKFIIRNYVGLFHFLFKYYFSSFARCVFLCRMLCFILLDSFFHRFWFFSGLFSSFHFCSTLWWFDASWINKMGLRLRYGLK